MSQKKGFTLIELLVVVAIIGILSSVVLASLNSARAKARDATRMSDMREIQKAIEIFYNDSGHYPIPGDVNAGGGKIDADCWQANNWISDGASFNWSTGYISKQSHDPIDNCCWPWGNCGSAGQAGTYEYWSDGTKYLIAARLENTSNPYRAEVMGVIDPRTGAPYANNNPLGKYCYVITN